MRILLSILSSLFIVSLLTTTVEAQSQNWRPSGHSKPKVKDWTFLVYLNGNNSLDEFGPFNINEMEKVGSTAHVNVVVQWASLSAKDTKRLFVTKDNNVNKVTSKVVQDMGQTDMGDWHNLVDFVRWGVKKYPAKHYFINVWNHGGGWHFQTEGKGLSSADIHPTDISWDDNSGHHITTPELGMALDEAAKIIGHKVDIYGSDACMMAMPEVAYEMANSVDVFVGSEETEPGQGWPYDTFLKAWTANSTATSQEVAKFLVKAYADSYNDGTHGTKSVTFSAFDMSKLGTFVASIKELSTNIRALNAQGKSGLQDAIQNSQKFAYSDYADLLDFLSNVKALKLTGITDSTVASVETAANDLLIANQTTGSFVGKAHGISMWIPSYSEDVATYWDKYKLLKFEAATSWGEALQSILSR